MERKFQSSDISSSALKGLVNVEGREEEGTGGGDVGKRDARRR
jgi:hypothetical protein